MNFVFLSGEANPLNLDASERRFMVVMDDVEPPNDEAHRGARQGASGGADCSAAT
jgi:hypothetical protein